MNKRVKHGVLVALAFAGLSIAGALACPACKDQVPTQKTASGGELVNPLDTQKGFALSIYVLLSSVYGCPAIICFLMWRSMRAAEARRRRERLAVARPI